MKKLVMICPTLVDQGGHEYDYTSMIASSALQYIGSVVTIIPSDAGFMPPMPGQTEPALPHYGYPKSASRRINEAQSALLSIVGFSCGMESRTRYGSFIAHPWRACASGVHLAIIAPPQAEAHTFLASRHPYLQTLVDRMLGFRGALRRRFCHGR